MSKLQVDDIVNKEDNGSVGFSRGAVVTGVCTATSFSGPADTFTVETSGSERLRANSSGNVGINSTIPRSKLHVANGTSNFNTGNPTGLGAGAVASLESNTDVALQFLTSTSTDNFIYFGDTDSATTGSIQYDHNVNSLIFNVNGGTERLSIDSNGRVKIGNDANYSASSGAKLSVELMSTAGTILEVADQTDGFSTLESVKNAGGGSSDYGGYILRGRRDADDDAKEYLRIDSSGRLLVGLTASTKNATIVTQGNSDNSASSAEFYLQRGQATPADGATFGTIVFGDSGGGQGATIVSQRDGGTWSESSKPGRLEFHTTADSSTSATERMRIHSGGVVSIPSGIELGSGVDATTANTLDDYEEGTFTPTAANFTVSGTSTLTGQYVKIGRQVTIGIKFANTGTIAHSVSAMIASLPFAMASGTEAHGLIGMLMNNNSEAFNSNQSGVQCKLDGEGGSRFFPGSFTTTSNGEQLLFGGTYIAAS